jgi:uncharacterized peroxidase-related enzyme
MFIATIEESAAESGLAQWYEQQRNLWGYLPNYAPAFATRPEVAAAWTQLNMAVRGGMNRRRFELATVAASRARSCTYCLAAHSKFLRDACSDEPTMRELAADPSGSSLDAVDAAVVGFAGLVATDPASVTADDVQHLRDLGLSDADVADIIFAVAARCFFATVLDATGAEADHQLAATFDPGLRDSFAVGRPFAEAPGGPGD